MVTETAAVRCRRSSGRPARARPRWARPWPTRLGVAFRDTDADDRGGRRAADLRHLRRRRRGRLPGRSSGRRWPRHCRAPGVLALGGGAILDPQTRGARWPGTRSSSSTSARRRGRADRLRRRPAVAVGEPAAHRGGDAERAPPVLRGGRDRRASTPPAAPPTTSPTRSWPRCRGGPRVSGDRTDAGSASARLRRRHRVAVVLDRVGGPGSGGDVAARARRCTARPLRRCSRRGRRRRCGAGVCRARRPRSPTPRRPRPRRWRPAAGACSARAGFTRTDAVVGVGGGTVTDLAGFVAATWLRGVRGRPRADDPARHGRRRRRRQDRHQHRRGQEPGRGVPPAGRACCATSTRSTTLPRHDLVAGLAEVVKCGFIADPVILDLVEARPGRGRRRRDGPDAARADRARRPGQGRRRRPRTCAESGCARSSTTGTPSAHAIEQVERYRWRHGEAVSVGMVYVAELARLAGPAGRGDVARPAPRRCCRVARPADDVPRADRWDRAAGRDAARQEVPRPTLRFVVLDGLGPADPCWPAPTTRCCRRHVGLCRARRRVRSLDFPA